jgi:hypothetical protein
LSKPVQDALGNALPFGLAPKSRRREWGGEAALAEA